tara:strand:+ start:746 stop:847 length:102 start_codon:yes stop_codon:yes gene_type:complete
MENKKFNKKTIVARQEKKHIVTDKIEIFTSKKL